MYTPFQLLKKYLHYYLTASNGKGHGIHSPFVFDFVKNVLSGKNEFEEYKIENLRNSLLRNKNSIEVEDFGAGSGIIKTKSRVIKDIAYSSLKPKKYAQLLAKIAKYYKCQTIIELGTSFGISTAYLASPGSMVKVYTLEGSENISNIAQNNFDKLGFQNINLIRGNFEDTFPSLLSKINKVDLAFIDGNHKKIPVMNYFTWLLAKLTDKSIFIFDDIHWSREMEEAWKNIQDHSAVTLTVDLFFIGLVFFSKDFKVKQHFVIRF